MYSAAITGSDIPLYHAERSAVKGESGAVGSRRPMRVLTAPVFNADSKPGFTNPGFLHFALHLI